MRTLLCSFGHIATHRELLDRFGQESAIVPLRRSSGRVTVLRIRTNVYVCAHLDPDELTAARVGAQLDCVTVLARHGLPVGDAIRRHNDGSRDDGFQADGPEGDGCHREPCLHLRLRPNDGRASARRQAEPHEIRVHWTVPRWPVASADTARWAAARGTPLSRVELPVEEALRQALTSCLTVAESLAVIEALLPRLDAGVLARIIARIPDHARTRLRRVGLPQGVEEALG